MALDKITSDSIAAGAITAASIPDSAITASKLSATAISDKLGFTPVSAVQLSSKADASNLTNVENKSSATIRSEITTGNVTAALGFTPYSSTNPNGYISDVVNALGYTPVSTTQLNNTIADVVGSAPAALNTLNELASALGNDANYASTITNALAAKANTSSLSAVATSGSYNDLTNKPSVPTLPTTVSSFTNDSGYLTSVSWSQVTSKPTFATVATTGSYNDLTSKPTIPTVPTTVGSFTNNVGYVTASSLTWSNISSKPNFATVATSGSYNDLTTKAAIDDLTDVTIESPAAGQAVVYTGTTIQIGGTFTVGSEYSSAAWNKNGGDVPIYGITSSALSSALVVGADITINYSGGNAIGTINAVSHYLNDYMVVISVTNSTGSAQSITSIVLPTTNQTTYSWKNANVQTLSPFLLMGS